MSEKSEDLHLNDGTYIGTIVLDAIEPDVPSGMKRAEVQQMRADSEALSSKPNFLTRGRA